MYVRHRNRMVRQSVFEDLRNTLIENEWKAGTTAHRIPEVTTTEANVLALLENNPVNLIDYFPEKEQGQGESIPINTFALDVGQPGDLEEYELGGMYSQEYLFNMAFYAMSDAVATAVFQDLKDRYTGLTRSEFIPLFDYWQDEPTFIVNMEVEAFRFARDAENVAPHEVHLYFAELVLTDFVDQGMQS